MAHDDHGHGAAALPPSHVRDMNCREFWALAPLVVFVFWIGLKPQTFLGADAGRHQRRVRRPSKPLTPSRVADARCRRAVAVTRRRTPPQPPPRRTPSPPKTSEIARVR